MSLVHVKKSCCIIGSIPFAFSEEANSINKESVDTMMDPPLEFSRQLAELPTSLGGMDWEDAEVVTFAFSGKSETMNNDSLEIMMDPSHELRTFKEQQIKEAYRMEQMDLEKKYGTDGVMLKLVCHETNAGLDKCVGRLDHGDEIHKQMRIMDGMRDNGNYCQAFYLCTWILSQDGRYGVCYDAKLLSILKETLAVVKDQVLFSEKPLGV
jgi:hypothetical protein